MKTCPECGNRYRHDVERCPNDGASLAPAAPPANAPPPTAPPPAAARPPRPDRKRPREKPAPTIADPGEPGSLRETSSAGAWIGVLAASLVMIGIYGVVSGKIDLDELFGGADRADNEAQIDDQGEAAGSDPGSTKRRTAKRKRARSDGASSASAEEGIAFAVDDREFGDLIGEGRDDQRRAAMAEARAESEEPPPFDPPPEMWDPSPNYRPSSRYAEPGRASNAVTLDLTAGASASAPLAPAAIERVLDERRLMPCYDEVVQKAPQMRGRVDLSFTVAPDGHVSRVVVTRSKLRSKQVEDCIVRRARGFRFPASESGRATSFDIHFDFNSR